MTQSALERAIQAAMEADPTEARYDRTEKGSIRHQRVERIVRAVLMAIREPSEAMLIAGADCRTSSDRFAGSDADETMKPEWEAMIDAALSEKLK